MRHKNRGVALITAVLVVALAAAAAAAIAASMQLHIRRSGNMINSDQAAQYAKALEAYALVLLKEDDNDTDTAVDLEEANKLLGGAALVLPNLIAPDSDGGIGISMKIEDRQGRFNLNNLLLPNGEAPNIQDGVKDPDVESFRQLLAYLDLPQNLVPAVIDWIDADINALPPDGAEDDYYSGLERPYRTPNRPMVHISELLLVKGFEERDDDGITVYEKIKPYVSALPRQGDEDTKINVNIAPWQILGSFVPNVIDEERAKALEASELDFYENEGDFLGQDDIDAALIEAYGGGGETKDQQAIDTARDELEKRVTVKSDYVVTITDVQIVGGRAITHSLLRRNVNGAKVEVFQRSQNPL